MVTTVNLPDDLHGDLKRVAEAEHRSANATIVMAIAEYVEKRTRHNAVQRLAADIAVRDHELLDRLAR